MKIVVLTKSAKRMFSGNFGNCVAGLTEDGEWIRLVSDTNGDSLSDMACKSFNCLDIIDVDVTPCPIGFHPENAKLEKLNARVGKSTIAEVVGKYGVDTAPFCFVNTSNKLNEHERQETAKSLMLICVKNLEVFLENDKSYKAKFEYNEMQYDGISVTDNRFKKPMKCSEAYIVASLPSETGGFASYYKFIAAIYPV